MTDEPGKFIETKLPCPMCSSSDAYALREDGSGYCFSCQQNFKGDSNYTPSKKRAVMTTDQVEMNELYNAAAFMHLKSRGILATTCAFLGYKVRQNSKGEWEHLSPYWDGPTLKAIHVRNVGKDGKQKKFYWIGDNKNVGLFGARTWQKKGKMLVITAGQIDCLTVSQVFGNSFSSASLPGGDSTVKEISRHLEAISEFEKVVLWFDNDEPSKAALEKAIQILPPGKTYIVDANGAKDANELLVQGGNEQLISKLIWNAKPHRPDGIVDVRDLRATLLKEPSMGTSWGPELEFLDEWTCGRRGGDNIHLGGGTASGKTTLLDKIIYNTISGDIKEPMGVFSWERSADQMAKHIVGMHAEKLFHIPQDPELEDSERDWTMEELAEAVDSFYQSTAPLLINDSWGAAEWDTVKERIRFLVHSEGVRHIVLDPFTALTANFDGDSTVSKIDKLTADFAKLMKELDITGIAVHHLTTPSDGKSHEEGARVRSNQFRGSRTIQAWATGMIGWERNQQAEDPKERLVGTVRLLKERLTGRFTGSTKKMIYDTETGIYRPATYDHIGPAVDTDLETDDEK